MKKPSGDDGNTDPWSPTKVYIQQIDNLSFQIGPLLVELKDLVSKVVESVGGTDNFRQRTKADRFEEVRARFANDPYWSNPKVIEECDEALTIVKENECCLLQCYRHLKNVRLILDPEYLSTRRNCINGSQQGNQIPHG